MIPIPDLLNREPFLGIDQKALSDLLGLAILGREIGTEFHDLMADAETPEAAWRPEFFEGDLFVDRLIAESFELRIDGVQYPINERFLRRALTATPTDLEIVEFRQEVLREMDEDGGSPRLGRTSLPRVVRPALAPPHAPLPQRPRHGVP